MVKKLAALAGAGAILLSVAVPVLAKPHKHHGGSSDVAMVFNGASATSNTGGNSQGDYAEAYKGSEAEVEVEGNSGDRKVETGEADADATAVVVANTHVSCGNCGHKGGKGPKGGESHTDMAMVGNGAIADANSGDNWQDDSAYAKNESEAEVEVENGSGKREIKTGKADSDADAWVVVNTHLEMGGHHHPNP